MKRLAVEIEKLVVDAAGIAPMHGEQFRVLVEQALRQRLNKFGLPPTAPPAPTQESVAIAVPPLEAHGHAAACRLAGHVARAIHQSLMRKA